MYVLLAIPIYKSNARGRSPISYLRSRSYSRQAEFSSSICHGKGKRYGISSRSIDRSMSSSSSKRRGPLESCSPATSKGSQSVLLFSLSREHASSFLARLNFDKLRRSERETQLLLKFTRNLRLISFILIHYFHFFFIFFRNPIFLISFLYISSFVGNRRML